MRLLAVAWVSSALALAGCQVNGGFGSTHFRCTDGRCPADFQCVANLCEPRDQPLLDAGPADGPNAPDAAGDGGVITDAAAPDGEAPDAAVASPCGTFSLLADDFNDGVRSTIWGNSFTTAPGTLSETGGVVTITLANGSASNVYSGYSTDRTYDLRGGRISAELVSGPNVATDAQAIIVATQSSGNFVQTIVQKGMLYFMKRVNNVSTTLGSIAYNPTDHRYLGLRGSSTNTYWETSPNGTTWTTRASDGLPINTAFVRLSLTGGTYQSETNPGTVVWDNVNGGVASGVWCKASTFKDTFDDAVRGIEWSRSWASGGCVASEGGQLTMTPVVGSQSYCGHMPSTAYDLTGSTITLELPQMVTTTNDAYVSLSIRTEDGMFADMMQQLGQIKMSRKSGAQAQMVASVPYSATAHRWWRYREAGGTLFWETSPDGSTWTTRFSETGQFPLNALDIQIEAGAPPNAVTNPGVAKFDNYNSPP